MRFSFFERRECASTILFTLGASFMWALFRPSTTFRLIEAAPARLWEHTQAQSYVALLVTMIVAAIIISALNRPKKLSAPLVATSALLACLGNCAARLSVTLSPSSASLVLTAGNVVLGVGIVLLWLCVMLFAAQMEQRIASIALVVSYLLNCLYVMGLSLLPAEGSKFLVITFPVYMGLCLLFAIFARSHEKRMPNPSQPPLQPHLEKASENPLTTVGEPLYKREIPRPLLLRVVFLVFSIYVGTFVWGLFFATTTKEISPFEHAITCMVSVMALLLVLGRSRQEDKEATAAQSANLAVVILLGLGLFLVQLLQLENVFMATGVVTAAIRCLKLLMWVLVLEAVSSRCLSVPRVFGIALVIIQALPPLLSNIVLPAFITSVMPQITKSSTDILVLCVMVLLFLSMIAFQSFQLNAAKAEGHSHASTTDDSPSENTDASTHPAPFREACDLLAQSTNLSPRETEVMRLLGRGYTQKRIATELYMADGTVRGYIRTIYSKIGVHSKQELIDTINHKKDSLEKP